MKKRLHILKINRRRGGTLKWAWRWINFLIILLVFGNFIANDRPLYCHYQGKVYFPVIDEYKTRIGLHSTFNETTDWQGPHFSKKIYAPIPYHYNTQDNQNRNYVSPFTNQTISSLRYRHWLGTDGLGRDILAGLIHGVRIAFWVGFIGIFISSIIGIVVGGVAGYYGDTMKRFSIWRFVLLTILSILLAWALYIGVVFKPYHPLLPLIVFFIILFLTKKIDDRFAIKQSLLIPIDLIIMRLIEVFKAIPKLLFILVLSAIFPPSVFTLAILIGFSFWVPIATLVRGEMLRIREMDYMVSSRLQGIPESRLIYRHALPNALGPAMIYIFLGFGSAVLAEAFLSFLGLGLSADHVSWGAMLSKARSHFGAWWMAVFPGLFIFLTIYATNIIGEKKLESIKSNR